ncbi:metabotropic glutamate receptor 2 [Lasius niger]|uniref:Metabotropic glutamate receptor 2 n=1 Tax=Lasius niger TaxID=67767 RepID=A0A0J7LA88_LASNI|nr:metabotropic glutamate receptor 2 [Lasius niger]
MRETEAEVYVNEDDDGGGKGGDGESEGTGGGGGSCGTGDSSDDDDEEERKLSTVQELSELNADTASPPISLAMCQACERSQGEPRRDSDQVTDFPRF